MSNIRIAQLKEFTLYKVPYKDKYRITIKKFVYDNFTESDINKAIARFIMIVEDWQGYRFEC